MQLDIEKILGLDKSESSSQRSRQQRFDNTETVTFDDNEGILPEPMIKTLPNVGRPEREQDTSHETDPQTKLECSSAPWEEWEKNLNDNDKKLPIAIMFALEHSENDPNKMKKVISMAKPNTLLPIAQKILSGPLCDNEGNTKYLIKSLARYASGQVEKDIIGNKLLASFSQLKTCDT